MISLFRRQPKLPADLRPALEPDERVLAWARVSADSGVVASTRGLYLPGRDRLAWHEVHRAAWSGEELTIRPGRVTERRDGYDVIEDLPPDSYRLTEPGDVPDQVRARVTKSVAYSTHYPEANLRVVARRVSGVDGLSWAVLFDPGKPRPAPESVAAIVNDARLSMGPEPNS